MYFDDYFGHYDLRQVPAHIFYEVVKARCFDTADFSQKSARSKV